MNKCCSGEVCLYKMFHGSVQMLIVILFQLWIFPWGGNSSQSKQRRGLFFCPVWTNFVLVSEKKDTSLRHYYFQSRVTFSCEPATLSLPCSNTFIFCSFVLSPLIRGNVTYLQNCDAWSRRYLFSLPVSQSWAHLSKWPWSEGFAPTPFVLYWSPFVTLASLEGDRHFLFSFILYRLSFLQSC